MSVSILLSGCSEKPDRKAAKEVRKSANDARSAISRGRNDARRIIREGERAALEAIKKGDPDGAADISQKQFNKAQERISESFEQARAKIEQSLRKNRNSGNAETPALITSGNILFSQALHLQSALAGASSPIDSFLDNISKRVLLMGDLATIKKQRETLITANEKEIRQFRDVLEKGTAAYPGLTAKLRAEEKKLVDIERQIKALEVEAKKARDTANSIEKSAVKKLRAADALSGDEKLALQNEAFDLRLSKKKYSMHLQSANDKIATLDTRAAIIAPTVTKIVSDISAIKDRIDSIIKAGGNDKLRGDIKAIEAAYNVHADSIKGNIDGVGAALKTYLAAFDEVTALLDQALGLYDKVKRGPSRQTAKNRKAACYLWKAGVYTECLRTQKNLISRIKSIIVASDEATADKLAAIVDASSTKVDDLANKAIENYDLAAKEYEGVPGNGEFACSVLKSRILALYGKMTLAEYLGDTAASKSDEDKFYAMSDDASENAEELAKLAKECDPLFANSVTRRMLDGEIDYTPKLRVDLAGHYEGIRKDFQSWNKLKGTDKEAEVNRLIVVLEEMKPAEDPEAFDRILEPELKLLKAAKKKGFDEDTSPGANSYGADPNY